MKRQSLIAISLLTAASAFAAEGQESQSMKSQSSDQMKMQQMEITPSAEPRVTRWAVPYLTADFLWWRAEQDGLEYAVDGIGNGMHHAGHGRLHRPHFRYEPGFKVGAGLKFRHDGWDLYAQYTWLYAHNSHSSAHTHNNSHLQSNIFVPGPYRQSEGQLRTFFFGKADADWSLHFNVLDLEIGRNFWVSKHLALRPFTGMKFSWNEQDFKVKYKHQMGARKHRAMRELKLDMDLDQFAVGIRSGLDTSWYIRKNWCIYGDFALSGIWNDFDSHRKDHLHRWEGVTLNHIRKDFHQVTAVLEWALGLRFQTAFHNDSYLFMLQAGWEEQIWFNQNQFVMMPNSTSANLSLEGLTIRSGFYF